MLLQKVSGPKVKSNSGPQNWQPYQIAYGLLAD
jgi:hypothetical protein